MSLARSLQKFFVVLLVTVQPVTASLAAQVTARGGLSPVHAARIICGIALPVREFRCPKEAGTFPRKRRLTRRSAQSNT
jgi:hypothetical protein